MLKGSAEVEDILGNIHINPERDNAAYQNEFSAYAMGAVSNAKWFRAVICSASHGIISLAESNQL